MASVYAESVSANTLKDLRVGEMISISCDLTHVSVEGRTPRYVFVAWPWRNPDPQSRFRWDSRVAFPRNAGSGEWMEMPWRIEPAPADLQVGSPCGVWIPATDAVREVQWYDKPLDIGWNPRPTVGVHVAPVSASDHEESGYMLYDEQPEPIRVVRRNRSAE
ncbi:hypothetical protein M2302_004906 [Micromonospora sp. A200]|uniref:hypothetical protein n=1 Tax=Micromonospora sp. A200 TaxID=2940568 RepID=UPI0024764B2D|nr:hypothetical protein [Micromonospora sp. A200]MDH6464705.1 hypothetical protein [Micromonospora sp. A200]